MEDAQRGLLMTAQGSQVFLIIPFAFPICPWSSGSRVVDRPSGAPDRDKFAAQLVLKLVSGHELKVRALGRVVTEVVVADAFRQVPVQRLTVDLRVFDSGPGTTLDIPGLLPASMENRMKERSPSDHHEDRVGTSPKGPARLVVALNSSNAGFSSLRQVVKNHLRGSRRAIRR